MDAVRWGMIGCGDVAEVKAGPGFQKAAGSALVALTRRDVAKARDYAARHGIARVHTTADDLIADPEVDAVYIATPPPPQSWTGVWPLTLAGLDEAARLAQPGCG